ncbi:Pkinase-domain-containing protein [Gloeophyllum trabeum ATCC 11539]|uniref:non-specific serine/threonine protein kinase n=1 Tax=Gloeophyllum trabeum (strain ATCC 11539 / FP-39264 / Madison 617) TaxID=670483 RepID=S7Q838_GLOTA|nr:Pkinase-domain-containing protein [Gloeophyllum trabeum ATCC 11539]EPQ55692.1 Pkinase-domain-containing protein [Gloeophyllum trabeum ATCC 11539]
MDASTSLQIPESSIPGTSRQASNARPVSVTVNSTPPAQSAGRHRASHNVVSSSQHQQENSQNDQPAYRDVYSHPAAIAYAAAHPRRTIPKFGPYLLLQTLGEGEFGKVKLGLHSQWGEEVAVKLIRRGNIDSNVRMSKIEREIEVLRTLKHPNIVRLYDVIETDKYIGIILEYASGGELFDHILAHRYLKEKDACKLFSQLISGVWYIHQKKIVHRDLKLENLLLDRNRNVIITDFGFANRFEHRADDLMQTSCGSPCYAAPELVISEGLYVGSAVDIWSCGVILYAMLAGYLPFDDDPDNPDGDNINLLYKYIVTTTLTFPPHISPEARDLLSLMLVADPARRADLPTIMCHQWLAPYHHLFTKTVEDLERAAMEQHQLKRLAYQRQMRQAAQAQEPRAIARTQSARTDGAASSGTAAATPSSRSRSQREGHAHHHQSATHSQPQPEYLYETSVDQSMYTSSPASRRGYNSAVVVPTSSQPVLDDDPFAPVPSRETPSVQISPAVGSPMEDVVSKAPLQPNRRREDDVQVEATPGRNGHAKASPESSKKKGGMRHTIQVEYGQNGQEQTSQPVSGSRREPTDTDMVTEGRSHHAMQGSPERTRARRPSAESALKPLPAVPPTSGAAGARREPSQRKIPPSASESSAVSASPRVAEEKPLPSQHAQHGSQSSGSSRVSGHKRGMSVDKLGLSKIFGASDGASTNGASSRVPSDTSQYGASYASENGTTKSMPGSTPHKRPSTLQAALSPPDKEKLSPAGTVEYADASAKKSRRNTLTVMVEPISRSIKNRTRGRQPPETPVNEKDMSFSQSPAPTSEAPVRERPDLLPPPSTPSYTNSSRTNVGLGMPASSSKAAKVMQWFRSKSRNRESFEVSDDGHGAPVAGDYRGRPMQPPSSYRPASTTPMQNSGNGSGMGAPISATPTPAHRNERRISSGTADTSIRIPWRSGGGASKAGVIRIHHGAVDQDMVTTRPPPEVMKHVREVLEGMGIEVQQESEFKYRCIRQKRKKAAGIVGLSTAPGSPGSMAAVAMQGTAASNGVDKRGLPVPSHSSFTGSGMLRGLLMRRQSSQVSSIGHHSVDETIESPSATNGSYVQEPSPVGEPLFGDRTEDIGDEVRFSVELTRIDRLNDTYSLDVRRLKGNLRSYKFLYDTLRDRAALQH